MAARALFIGIGGSGGWALAHLHRELNIRLRDAGWNGGMPDAWQFLQIDARSECEVPEGGLYVPPELRDELHYLGLTRRNDTYEEYTRVLRANVKVAGGWMPRPDAATGDLWEGAGQKRAVGRVLFLDSADRAAERIRHLVTIARGPEATEQLREIGERLGGHEDEDELNTWIFTSLGGGSGAGIHLDVSLLLHGLAAEEPSLRSHLTVAFPADIFDSLPTFARLGVVPNSLGSISEMLNIFNGPAQPTAAEEAVLNLARVRTALLEKNRGPKTVFVQGRTNGVISLESSSQVYRATARSVVALHLDRDIRENFRSKVVVNPPPVHMPDELVPDELLGPNSEQTQMTSAFGYATVTLGRGLFATYAAQRLARLTADQIREPDGVRERELATRRDEFLPLADDFATRAGLEEEGRRQVTEALLANFRSVEDVYRQKVVSPAEAEVRRRVGESGAGVVGDAERLLGELLGNERRRFRDAQGAALIESIHTWIPIATERLRETVIDFVASQGTSSTLFCLDVLIEQLERVAGEGLHGSSPTRPSGATSRVARSATTPPTAASAPHDFFGRVRRTAESAKSVIDAAASVVEQSTTAFRSEWESFVAKSTAELLRGFATKVVRPMRDAVDDMRRGFQGLLSSGAEAKRLYDALPVRDPLPSHLPAPNELILDEDGFREQLDEVAVRTLAPGGVGHFDDVVHLAIGEILRGATPRKSLYGWPTDDGEIALVSFDGERERTWSPRFADGADGAPPDDGSAHFVWPITLERLLDWATLWTATRKGIASHTHESLGDYLNIDGAEGTRRRQTFLSKLTIAIDYAAPMVALNENAIRVLHGNEMERALLTQVSAIPLDVGFDTDHDQIVDLLTRSGDLDAERRFNRGVRTGEVNVTRFLGAALHPATMDSIMRPILREWGEPSSAAAFWSCRRARQIPGFVPLAPDVQERLVRGWYILTHLGFITVDDVRAFAQRGAESPLRVPTSVGPRALPTRFFVPLTESTVNHVVPRLLESVMVAFIELTAGETDNLEAYRSLAAIGRRSADILRELIATGHVSIGDQSREYMPDASPDDRAQSLLDRLKGQREHIRGLQVPADAPPWDDTAYSPVWETRNVIDRSLSHLIDSVENHVTLPGADTDLI